MSQANELKEFDKITAGMAAIQDEGNFIPDMTSKEGYEASKRFVLDVTTPTRTALNDAHKTGKAYWLNGGRAIDAKKNELMSLLESIQEPHKLAYKEVDQEKKLKKERFEADIQAKIDVFSSYINNCNGANSEQIAAVIQECGETDTQEGFYHRAADACKARNEALEFLNDALSSALSREVEQKAQAELFEQNRLAAIQLEEQQEKMRLQQEEMNAKQAEIDRAANEIALKSRAEADEKQRLINEAEQAKLEKQRAIEREEYAKKQAEQAAEQAKQAEIQRQQAEQEAQRIADEKRANNNRNVTKIKKQAKEFIMSFGVDEKTAVKLVQAISHKEENTLTINY